jgi:hypothetical protein
LPLQCGDTFLLPKSRNQTEHLWIVVAEIDAVTGKAICVSVTTRRPHSDPTCVLDVGDHPFVSHPSVIFYQDTRQMDLVLVESALTSGIRNFVCTRHASCSDALLERIRKGLIESKQTPKGIKELCRKLWKLTLNESP